MFCLSKKNRVSISVCHSLDFFHIAIVGRSGCGKTKFLLQLLQTEFYKKFNSIFLICPTFMKNQSYDSYYSDDKFYVLSEPVDQLEYSICLAREESSKYFRSLIIFDDVIGNKVLNSRTSSYVNLLIGGRHDGISTITLSQQLTSISKPARDQLTRIVSFYNPDGDDRKIMFGKYLCDVTPEEMTSIIAYLRSRDYSKIDINILKGTYTLLP